MQKLHCETTQSNHITKLALMKTSMFLSNTCDTVGSRENTFCVSASFGLPEYILLKTWNPGILWWETSWKIDLTPKVYVYISRENEAQDLGGVCRSLKVREIHKAHAAPGEVCVHSRRLQWEPRVLPIPSPQNRGFSPSFQGRQLPCV